MLKVLIFKILLKLLNNIVISETNDSAVFKTEMKAKRVKVQDSHTSGRQI